MKNLKSLVVPSNGFRDKAVYDHLEACIRYLVSTQRSTTNLNIGNNLFKPSLLLRLCEVALSPASNLKRFVIAFSNLGN
jgi:hypothetical protein